jgi:AAA domain, putative AbiEii toxin, Type IV TA system
MLHHLAFRDVGPAPELSISLAPRINLITGDNGLGKTFLLEAAWWALTRTWAGHPLMPRRGPGVSPCIEYRFDAKTGAKDYSATFDFEQLEWPIPKHRPADPGMVLYARVDGSFAVWDPARNYWKNAPSLGIEEPERPAAYHFPNPQDVWDGRPFCNGLIRDWVSWQDKGGHAFAQLGAILDALSPSATERLKPGIPMRISDVDPRDIPTLETPYGAVPIVHAAAGIKRIAALAYLLTWTWQEHQRAVELKNRLSTTTQVIFLIDEIEAHLHPKWQRTILPAMLEVVQALGLTDALQVQIVATTHSPLVLASLEPRFDPEQDAVLMLDLVGDEVQCSKYEWRPRGDSSAWLTSEIFDLGEARSLEAEQAIANAEGALDRPDISPEQLREVHRRLREVLKDTDQFWPRWLFRAEQMGLEP